MRKFKIFALTVAALFAVKGLALATPINSLANKGAVQLTDETLAGTATLGLNGKTLDVDVNPVFNADGTISYSGVHVFDDGNKTTFNIFANPDPEIVYGVVFGPTPGVGPNNYSFDFSQPFLGGPFNQLHSDFSGSATFGGTGAGKGGSITDINVQADVNGVFVPGVNLLGFSCASVGNGSTPCGQGSADSPFSPAVSAPGTFSVHIDAKLSGPSDVGTFNGRVELSSAVPEPGTILLLGSGLLGLALLKRKQAR